MPLARACRLRIERGSEGLENRTRVVITGVGAVCGNASSVSELETACAEGISGIRPCTVFDASALRTDRFGQAESVSGPDRLFALMSRACGEMLSDANLTREDLSALGSRCRLFWGTLLSTAESYLAHSQAALDGAENHGLAMMNAFVSHAVELTGVRGTADVSSAACASGTTALGMAFDFIRCGLCDCAVAGGADALNPLSAFGFHALKALSADVCNPYDERHDGISIGECGAFFFLESLEHARARGARVHAEIRGYALGNDAYHITSPEPEGTEAARVMRSALNDAGLAPEQVDYINGHGTGTVLNDTMETKALSLVFGQGNRPHVSSTKALIGHCMGASGAIEAASVLGVLRSGKPLRMPNLSAPLMGESRYAVPDRLPAAFALSNSFGFAGNNASLVLRAWADEPQP